MICVNSTLLQRFGQADGIVNIGEGTDLNAKFHSGQIVLLYSRRRVGPNGRPTAANDQQQPSGYK